MQRGDRRGDRPPAPHLTRRQFLGAGAAAATTATAAAFPAPRGFPLRRSTAKGLGPGGSILHPGTRPYPDRPAGTDQLPKIEHIVVLMMENHSFDDHLGMLGRGDGLTIGSDGKPLNYNPDPKGGYVRSFHNPNTVGVANANINQAWDTSHICWDNGTNMGFVKGCSPQAMGYWEATDLPFYYSMARRFPIGDRYFCSVMAQTYPNRRFLIAGTALGNVSTDGTGISSDDAPNGVIFDRFDHYGITWKNYFTDIPTSALFGGLALLESRLNNGKCAHIAQFFEDAAAGNLPQFSIIDPYINYSEENNDISIGEAYAARVIDAVLAAPTWKTTALIWTYDEHGGWYDHVPPAPALKPDSVPPEITVPPDQPGAYDYTGFRVPCCVVSPWSKRDHVSHTVYDHTSILKFIETKWNLPSLTYRDANAHDMLDFFDFSGSAPFEEPPTLARPLNPFPPGPLPPGSTKAADVKLFHPIAQAVPADSYPLPSDYLTAPPPDADKLIAEHAAAVLATPTGIPGHAGTKPVPPSKGAPLGAIVGGSLAGLAVVGVGAVALRARSRRANAQPDAEPRPADTRPPDTPAPTP